MANQKKKAGRPVGRIITKHETVDLHPQVDEDQFKKSWNLFRNGFSSSFQSVFGLPAALLRGEHRRKLEEAVKGEYPRLRKSAARMFFEGMLTGDRGPLQTVPVGAKARLETVLSFLDVLETMVYCEGMKRLAELDVLAAPKTQYRPLMGGKTVYQSEAKRIVDERKRAKEAGGESGEAGEQLEPECESVVAEDVSSDLGGLLDEFSEDPDGDIARVEGLAADELENDRLI